MNFPIVLHVWASIYLFKVLKQSPSNVSFRETWNSYSRRKRKPAAGWETAGLLGSPAGDLSLGPATQAPALLSPPSETLSRQPQILSTLWALGFCGSFFLKGELPMDKGHSWWFFKLRHWHSAFRKLDFVWNWLKKKKIQWHEDNPTIWIYLEWIKIVLIWERGCNSRRHLRKTSSLTECALRIDQPQMSISAQRQSVQWSPDSLKGLGPGLA